MAVQSIAKPDPSQRSETLITKIRKNRKIAFAFALLFADAIFVALIIAYIPYTKIDWDAYMSQVSGFLEGERDYGKLKGDTGPLVYPAGFLYIYSAIHFVTGGLVYPAQILFGLLYIVNLGIVLFIYVKTDVLPWWALSLLCLSKRIHSIFVLRLFNDCLAMTLLHASLISLLYQKWNLGLIIFSGAVSIKMNVLLYAPPLLPLMLKAMDISGVILALAGAAFVQILVGLPFLLSSPVSYISRAFNLGRVFIHFWSVNFKFVPEPIFVSRAFAISLLVTHLILLAVFSHYKWCKHEGGLFSFLHSRFVLMKLATVKRSGSLKQIYNRDSSFKLIIHIVYRHEGGLFSFLHSRFVLMKLATVKRSGSLKQIYNRDSSFKLLREDHIVTTMFVGNFIGVVCARSLHYQFYSWYFYSLPYMLWKTPFPTFLRLILFIGVEFCWNVYPSNMYSSAVLLFAHLLILWGLWTAPPEYPYVDDNSSTRKKRK